jgi:hypothetical protein
MVVIETDDQGIPDPQQMDVYSWEGSLLTDILLNHNNDTLDMFEQRPLHVAQRVVDWCYKRYGIQPPVVLKGDKGQAIPVGSLKFVVLPGGTGSLRLILHEASHGLANWFQVSHWARTRVHLNHGNHGAIFMRVYINLLSYYSGVPLRMLELAAYFYGLEVIERSFIEENLPVNPD